VGARGEGSGKKHCRPRDVSQCLHGWVNGEAKALQNGHGAKLGAEVHFDSRDVDLENFKAGKRTIMMEVTYFGQVMIA